MQIEAEPIPHTLHFPSDDVFASLRASFHQFGYNEETVRSRYFFKGSPGDLLVFPQARQKPESSLSALDVLVHLFLGQESLRVDLVARLFGNAFLAGLQATGLLQIRGDEICRASVRLEPVEGFLICADLVMSDSPRKSDFVYRPWDFSAQAYTRMIPPTECGSFLEMCCGSAYSCFRAARGFAQSASGVDINARAIHFAEFGKRLNDVCDVELYCGDLFSPIEDRRFDRIVAHPPYVPAVHRYDIYKDGGPDGEEISSRLISALPRHLSDRGTFHGYLLISDRKNSPAEMRVREMLGPDGQEFDIALLTLLEESPASFLGQRPDPNFFSSNNQYLRKVSTRLEITRFVKAFLTISPRRSSTANTVRYPAAGWQTMLTMAGLTA